MPLQTGSIKKVSVSNYLKGRLLYDRTEDHDPDDLMLKNRALSWYGMFGDMPKKNLILLTNERIEWYNAETMKPWFSYNLQGTLGASITKLRLFEYLNIDDSEILISAKNGKVSFFNKSSSKGVILDFARDSFVLFDNIGIISLGNIAAAFSFRVPRAIVSTSYANKTTKILPYTELKAIEIVRNEFGDEFLLLMANNGTGTLVQYVGSLNYPLVNITSSYNQMSNINFSTVSIGNDMALYSLKGQLKIYFKMKINTGYAFVPNLAVQSFDLTTFSDMTISTAPLDPLTNEIESIGFDYSFGTQKLHVAAGLKGEYDELATDYKYKNGGVVYFIVDMTDFTIKNTNYVRILNSNLVLGEPTPAKMALVLPSQFYTERMQSVQIKNDYLYIGASELDLNSEIIPEDANKGGLVIYKLMGEDYLWDQTTGDLTLLIAENYDVNDTDFTGDAWTLNDVWNIQAVNDNDFFAYTPAYYWIETAATLPPIQNFDRTQTTSHTVTYTISLEDKTNYSKIEFYAKKVTDLDFQLWKTVYLDAAASVISVKLEGLVSDTQYEVKAIPYSAGAQGPATAVDTFTTTVEYLKPLLSYTTHDDEILLNIKITDTRINEIEHIEVFKQVPGDSKPYRIGKIPVDNTAHKLIPLLSSDPNNTITGTHTGVISYFKLDTTVANNLLPNGLDKDATIDVSFQYTTYQFSNVKVLSVNYDTQVISVDPSQIFITSAEPIDPSVNISSFKMNTYVYNDKGVGVQPGTTIQYFAKLTSEYNESLMSNAFTVTAPNRILDPMYLREKDFWRASLNFDPYSASLYKNYQSFSFNNSLIPADKFLVLEDRFAMLNSQFPNDMTDFEFQYPATSSNFELVQTSGVTGDTSLVLKTIPQEILADRMKSFLSTGASQNMEVVGLDPINSFLRTLEPTTEASWRNIIRLQNETVVGTNAKIESDPISIENINFTSSDFKALIDKVYKIDTTSLSIPVTEVDFANDSSVVVLTADEFMQEAIINDETGKPMLRLDPNVAYKFEFNRNIPISKLSFDATHVLFGDHEVSAQQVFEETSSHTDSTKPDFGYTPYDQQFISAEELYELINLPIEKQFELHLYYQNPLTQSFEYISYNNFKFEDLEPKLTRVKSFILRNKVAKKAMLGHFNSGVTWIDLAPDTGRYPNITYWYRWRATYWYKMTAVNDPMILTNDMIAEIFYTHYITYKPEGATETQIETLSTMEQMPRYGNSINIGKIYTGLENATQWSVDIRIKKIFLKSYNAEIRILDFDLDSTSSLADEEKPALYVKTTNKAVYTVDKILSIKDIHLGVQSKEINDIIIHTIKFIFSADGRRWYYLNTDTRQWVEVEYGTKQTHVGSNTALETSEITYEEWNAFFELYDDPKNFYLGLIYLISNTDGPFPGFENADILFEIENKKELNSSIETPVFKPPRTSKLFDLVIIKDEPKGNRSIYDTRINTYIRYSTDNGKTWNLEGWIPVETTGDIRKIPEFDNMQADNFVFQLRFDFHSSVVYYPTLRKVDVYMMDVYKIPELIYPALGAPISDQDIDVVWLAPENLVEGTEHFAIEVAKKDFDDPTYNKANDRLIAYKSFSEDKKPFRSTEDGFIYEPTKFGYNSFYIAGTNPASYVWNQIMGLNPGVEGFEKVNGVPADGKHYVRFTHRLSTPVDVNRLYFRIHVWDGSMGSES